MLRRLLEDLPGDLHRRLDPHPVAAELDHASLAARQGAGRVAQHHIDAPLQRAIDGAPQRLTAAARPSGVAGQRPRLAEARDVAGLPLLVAAEIKQSSLE